MNFENTSVANAVYWSVIMPLVATMLLGDLFLAIYGLDKFKDVAKGSINCFRLDSIGTV
jgi:hypothetical protein